jgi:hypothetical protein
VHGKKILQSEISFYTHLHVLACRTYYWFMRPWLYQFEEATNFLFSANMERFVEHSMYKKLIRLPWVPVYMLLTHVHILDIVLGSGLTEPHVIFPMSFVDTAGNRRYRRIASQKTSFYTHLPPLVPPTSEHTMYSSSSF